MPMPRATCNLPGRQPETSSPLRGSLPQPSPTPSRGPSLLSPAQGAQHQPGCAQHWGGPRDAGWGGEGKNKTTRGLRRNCHLRLSHSCQRASGPEALEGTQLKIALEGWRPPATCPARTGLVPRGHQAAGWLCARHRQGGLKRSRGDLAHLRTAPQQGFFQARVHPKMPALPSAPRQSPGMLL